MLVGLTQGLVPLISRLAFDHTERLAIVSRLAAPWWWVVCLGVCLASSSVLLLARRRTPLRAVAAGTPSDEAPPSVTERAVSESNAVPALVLLVAIYNGVLPFVTHLASDRPLLFSPTSRLAAPWWWLTSLAVLAVSTIALAWIDKRHDRRRSG